MRNWTSLRWLLLIPYFTVREAKGNQEDPFVRRLAAQALVALIVAVPIIVLLPTRGPVAAAISANSRLTSAIVLFPCWLLIRHWIGGQRERQYLAEYRKVSRRRRKIWGLSAFAIVASLIVVGAVKAPKHAAKNSAQYSPSGVEG
ncbi:hypothetical protein ABDK56_08145 [Sphingomonas sp. ASV193]|uniref:hypothetical protein n=1 Tax=Sphingomonas sp. ASV193 TaxID=3144405 RepID=UPI0032E9019D